jgi:hypothetical protein
MNILIFSIISYLGFTVGPAKVEKTMLGAEKLTEVFEVQNFTDDSLRIKVEFEDFGIDGEGIVTFYDPGYFDNSLGSRAIVNPEEFIVPPRQIEKVRVTFDLLRAGEIPEYYSMLLFKSRPIPTKYSTAINVAGEIGVPIYYTMPDYASKAASFESLLVRNDSLEIVLSNTGNVHLRIRGEVVITTYDSKIVQQDSLPEFVVMPGKQRRLKVGVDRTLEAGSYVVKVVFDYGAIELIVGERKFNR